ncbi:adenylyl cyclase class-3/4/guanylyl cyclase [Beggiatoa sp. PS]|nr:adenylyl cyclase class-3/4/guanylyl cyclase [Beggiatoa sp. PS]
MNCITHFHQIKATQHAFEQQLAQQMLVSEKKRITILTIVLSLIALYFFTMACCFSAFFPPAFFQPIYGLPFWIWFELMLVGAAIYEYCLLLYLNHIITAKKQFITLFRYFNVFEETSLPTIAIFLLSQVINPIYALVSPSSFIYFIFIVLSSLRLDFKLCLFTGTVAALEYLSLALFFISSINEVQITELTVITHHVMKAILLFSAGLITGLITLELKKRMLHSFESIQERNDIANIFGQHVSPAVVEKLLHQEKELSTEMREVCVMFLDIRDFTAFSETHSPEKTVDFLNRLFEPMIDIVNRHQGIINKFLGDGFMAIFGAPFSEGSDSQNAVNAAREIVENVKQKITQGDIPPIRIGIGLHTGNAVTGNVGSSQRKEYTVIGDVVNLASRIEQLNKTYGSQLLISGAVWKAIGKSIDTAIDKGPVYVKGRTEAVQIYQIL